MVPTLSKLISKNSILLPKTLQWYNKGGEGNYGYTPLDLCTLLYVLQKKSTPLGPDFPNYYDKQWSLHLPIVFDGAPSGKKFGDVKQDINGTYKRVSL